MPDAPRVTFKDGPLAGQTLPLDRFHCYTGAMAETIYCPPETPWNGTDPMVQYIIIGDEAALRRQT